MRTYFSFLIILFLSFKSIAGICSDDGEGIPRIVINPKGHSGKIYSLNYTPDGEKIISVSEDKSIRVWDVETGKTLKNFYCQIGDGLEGMLYTSAISPNGKLLAVGGYPVSGIEDNYVILIDIESGRQVGPRHRACQCDQCA